ncbi:sterol-sensing domain of SREBP cleavage-activation-domain-containing protein [Lipomyces kononenkoae]
MLRTAVLALSRGSKYANDLTPAHELFRLYQRYAVRVVRSPQSFIIWSAVTALALSYPLLYAVAIGALSGSSDLFAPSTSSLSCGPSAESFIKDLSGVTADIAVKQAFVRGSNDAALERDVFDLAWEIQERLTDRIPLNECVLLSPAGFWGNAIEKFEFDADPLSTINLHAVLDGNSQMVDDYLPPQSVLAGAHFDDGRVVSCDALVISLFYRPASTNLSISEVWDRNVQDLQVVTHTGAGSQYEVENSSHKSRLEFLHRLSPLSHRANTILMASYFLAVFYIVSSLQRMRALRSRVGLFIAFSVEVTLSMIGASTVIYFTHLDLSMIPKQAFPFIVIVLSTENMFRLLNALSYTKPEQPAIVRIGTALGKVGFLSTVTTACNICLFLLAIFISGPPIKQVCTFAIIATVIDYILHMTYFLAVLSIDVRRLELEDLIQTSLGAASNDTDDSDEEELISKETVSWSPFPKIISYFWDGSVPTTTSAGIATTACFLVTMQLHYMRNTDFILSLLNHVSPWPVDPFATMTSMVNSTLVSRASGNQSNRTDWFRVNDLLFSERVLATLAPRRNSFAIQLFEPVYFTLTSSTRSDKRINISFPSAGYVVQFVIVIALALVSTALLLRHMLRDVRDEDVVDPRFNSSPAFVTKDLSGSHSLDVIKLATSTNGVVASVGLDHRILLWQVNARRRQKPTKVSLSAESWPVTSIALDQDGKYLAVCGKDGTVHCWNIVTSRFVWSVGLAGLVNASPVTILFLTEKVPGMVTRVSLVIVGRNGMLYQVATDSGGVVFEHKISDRPLVSAEKLFTPRLPKRIVSATKDGTVIITTLVRTTWITEPLELRPGLVVAMTQQNMEPMFAPAAQMMLPTQTAFASSRDSTTIIALPQIGMVLRARGILVDLIDVQTGTIVKVFQIATYKKGTLRAFHDHTQHCPFCGCSTIASLCILYCERESGMMMMHSYINSNRARRNICLRVERDLRERRCIGFEGVLERQHWLDNVSGWEVTDINVVMGIRRKTDVMVDNPIGGDRTRGLRYRGSNGIAGTNGTSYGVYDTHASDTVVEQQWEGWTMSMDGTVGTYELRPEEDFRQPRSITRQLTQSSSDDGGYEADINSTMSSSGRRKRRQHGYHDHHNRIRPPHRSEQELLVSHIGPVAKLGHRSMIVGFGNTVKVLYFGSEEIISPNDDDDDDVGLAYVSRRRRGVRRSESRGSVSSVGRESPTPSSPSVGGGGLMRGALMSRGGGQSRIGGLMRGGAGRY